MAQAKRDDNNIPTKMGVLNTDGATPTLMKADPSTHILQINDGTNGSDFGADIAARDNNGEHVLIATDGSDNIITLYVNSSGQLLIKST